MHYGIRKDNRVSAGNERCCRETANQHSRGLREYREQNYGRNSPYQIFDTRDPQYHRSASAGIIVNWPWQHKPEPPATNPWPIIEMARHERERARRLIELLLPPIDPNDTFDPLQDQEEEAK